MALKALIKTAAVAGGACFIGLTSLTMTDSAQAAIISGSISGTWDYNDAWEWTTNLINAGDTFTAHYTYDERQLFLTTTLDERGDSTGYWGYLLSLVVESGSYSHTFDFSDGGGSFSFSKFVGNPTGIRPYISKYFSISAFNDFWDGTEQRYNWFFATRYIGEYYDNSSSWDSSRVNLVSYVYLDHVGLHQTYDDVYSNNVMFTPDPTSVIPTPALLPGLLGMGIAALRKRKSEANQASEA